MLKNILYIKCSPRGDESFSLKLGEELLTKLKAHYYEITVTTVDFAINPPSHLTGQQLNTFFTPLEDQTVEQKKSAKESDRYIAQLMAHDIIVISYPVWNYLIPSCLKAWIDQIVRIGMTVQCNGHSSEGLILRKKVYLVLARGGIYPESFNNDIHSFYDFSIQYMQTILSYVGMTDISVIKAEGLAISNLKDTAFEKAVQSIYITP